MFAAVSTLPSRTAEGNPQPTGLCQSKLRTISATASATWPGLAGEGVGTRKRGADKTPASVSTGVSNTGESADVDTQDLHSVPPSPLFSQRRSLEIDVRREKIPDYPINVTGYQRRTGGTRFGCRIWSRLFGGVLFFLADLDKNLAGNLRSKDEDLIPDLEPEISVECGVIQDGQVCLGDNADRCRWRRSCRSSFPTRWTVPRWPGRISYSGTAVSIGSCRSRRDRIPMSGRAGDSQCLGDPFLKILGDNVFQAASS